MILSLLLAVTIEVVPGARVGVYQDHSRRGPALAQVISYSRSGLMDAIHPFFEAYIEERYCFTPIKTKARKGEIFRVRKLPSAQLLNRIYRRARAGKRVFLTNVGRSDYHKLWAIHIMIRSQYNIYGSGTVDLDDLRRDCEE